MKDRFKAVYSIELVDKLFKKAQNFFNRFSHIHIFHGDIAEILPSVISNIEVPCLFWLDGHFFDGITAKGVLDTPIEQELQTILRHSCKDHVILIDDARDFLSGAKATPKLK
ncbi:MAG: hypothetical protein HQM12_15050 [SAR324 cluster bacterium]|nr:hypothetical protein [SAR324 cluster bacterium]